MEDQLWKVKLQYTDVSINPKFFELSPENLIQNTSLWFISLLQNTDLELEGKMLSAQEYLEFESLSRGKSPPYDLLYPSLVWFLHTLGKERLEYLFGTTFYDRINELVKDLKN
jgi:hypothetical protein